MFTFSYAFVINATALGITSIAALGMLTYMLRFKNHTTGTLMMRLTGTAITLWLVLSLIEIFYSIPVLVWTIPVVGTFMVVGFLMIALVLPNRPLTPFAWFALIFGIFISLAAGIPDVLYSDMIHTNKGYAELIPGKWFVLHESLLLVYLVTTLIILSIRVKRTGEPLTRFLLSVYLGSLAAMILIAVPTILLLPALGISEYSNLGTAMAITVVLACITYTYARQRKAKLR